MLHLAVCRLLHINVRKLGLQSGSPLWADAETVGLTSRDAITSVYYTHSQLLQSCECSVSRQSRHFSNNDSSSSSSDVIWMWDDIIRSQNGFRSIHTFAGNWPTPILSNRTLDSVTADIRCHCRSSWPHRFCPVSAWIQLLSRVLCTRCVETLDSIKSPSLVFYAYDKAFSATNAGAAIWMHAACMQAAYDGKMQAACIVQPRY